MLGDDPANFPFHERRQPDKSNTNSLSWLGWAASQFRWNGLVGQYVNDMAVQYCFRYIRLVHPWLSKVAGGGKMDRDRVPDASDGPMCLNAQAAAAEIDDDTWQGSTVLIERGRTYTNR